MIKAFLALFLIAGCVSWDPKDQKKAPDLSVESSLEERIAVAIDFGGNSIVQARKLMEIKGDASEVRQNLEDKILNKSESWSDPQFIHAIQLYELTRPVNTESIFNYLTKFDSSLKLKLGWRLAGVGTSPKLMLAIDNVLTRDFGVIEKHLIPEMAFAVRTHRVQSVYSVLRLGLMSKGEVAFVLAMASLRPIESSNDFMAYLQLAPADELRQRTLVSVNSYTCSAILTHLEEHVITSTNSNLVRLFEFAVSRNIVLGRGARRVLEAWAPTLGDVLSEELAKAETYVQIAFIEGTRRDPTPNIKAILEKLKTTTTHAEVLDDLANLRL